MSKHAQDRMELEIGRLSGFTLIELMIVMSIIGTLSTIAYPALTSIKNRALVARAIGDIDAIQLDIMGYEATNLTTPLDLNAIGRGSMLDPWGNPYQYLSFAHAGGGGGGGGAAPPGARKDKFLHPLNSSFDLYSMGPDGQSKKPLTAKASHDDIIMANDGGFIGIAKNY